VAASTVAVKRSRGPFGVGVQELVLSEGHPRIDVHEAVDARDAGICRDPPRVVVERGEVRGAGRRSVRPDRDRDGGELALAERVTESVERRARWDVRREDARVRGVEAHVEERGAEQQQERQGGDEHRDRSAHDPSGEPSPWTLGLRSRLDLPYRVAVKVAPEQGQERREERQRGRDGEADDDRAGDADRAQDHELEEDEAEQPEQHGQAAEEDRPPGVATVTRPLLDAVAVSAGRSTAPRGNGSSCSSE
jgi:hypothetical protein